MVTAVRPAGAHQCSSFGSAADMLQFVLTRLVLHMCRALPCCAVRAVHVPCLCCMCCVCCAVPCVMFHMVAELRVIVPPICKCTPQTQKECEDNALANALAVHSPSNPD